MKMNTYDLIIKAGKVFCSYNKLDTPGAIGIKNGKIVEFNVDIKTKSVKTLNYPKGTLLPGFHRKAADRACRTCRTGSPSRGPAW